MERKPKTLIMTIRYACPIESANVPEVLARIAGKDGHAKLVSTDVERGDIEAYKARHLAAAKAEVTPTAKPGPKGAKAKPRPQIAKAS